MKNKALKPSYVALDLTYRCGLDCSFCFVKRNGLSCGRELGLPGWLKLIRGLGPERKKFYLTGGEPLLRPFLPALIRELRRRGHSVLVTTGACAAEKAALELARSGPDEIVISAHGWPELHDAAAGRGSWRKTLRNFELLKAHRRPGTRLTLWCTINSANHARLHKVYLALAALGADAVAFNHLEFISAGDAAVTRALLAGAGYSTPVKSSADLAKGIDPAKLAAEIARIRRAAGPAVKFYPSLSGPEMRAWYRPDADFRKAGLCLGQFNAAWFSPDGRMITCQPLAVNMGSCAQGAQAAYNGRTYSGFRKLLIKSGGFLPACRRCGRAPYTAAIRGRNV